MAANIGAVTWHSCNLLVIYQEKDPISLSYHTLLARPANIIRFHIQQQLNIYQWSSSREIFNFYSKSEKYEEIERNRMLQNLKKSSLFGQNERNVIFHFSRKSYIFHKKWPEICHFSPKIGQKQWKTAIFGLKWANLGIFWHFPGPSWTFVRRSGKIQEGRVYKRILFRHMHVQPQFLLLGLRNILRLKRTKWAYIRSLFNVCTQPGFLLLGLREYNKGLKNEKI